MPKKSNLVNETLMYSINPGGRGEVITHHLPFARTSPHLETYLAKGFTFEKPLSDKVLLDAQKMLDKADVIEDGDRMLAVTDGGGTHIVYQNPLRCKECGFLAKTPYGLRVHQRRHKK